MTTLLATESTKLRKKSGKFQPKIWTSSPIKALFDQSTWTKVFSAFDLKSQFFSEIISIKLFRSLSPFFESVCVYVGARSLEIEWGKLKKEKVSFFEEK